MTDKIVLRSPLAAKTAGGPLQMREVIGQSAIVVRGNISDAQFAGGFENALGIALPESHHTATTKGEQIIFRLGPDEWLVRDSESARQKLCDRLRTETSQTHAAIVDVSDYYTIIQIAGDGARDALAAACPLDLHPRTFAAGDHAQSRFGAAGVLLYQRDDKPTFDLQVRWSFADYVWEYLRAAENA